MDSAALDSLTPLLDGIDRWVELAPLLPVIISLELILSADNAVALASITKSLSKKDLQQKALNIGIIISLCLRLLLILFSKLLLKFSFIKFICSIYLIFLSIRFIIQNYSILEYENSSESKGFEEKSLFKVIVLLSFTDLAFSIDSITAAVSISDQLLLVITGALIGVIALRFTSSLFVRWLDLYTRLELSGYIAIGAVGFKLLLQLIFPRLTIPEYIVFLFMTILLTWGFSLKREVIN